MEPNLLLTCHEKLAFQSKNAFHGRGMLDHWFSFAYTYIVGGLIFVISMFVILRTGGLNLKFKRDRWLFQSLTGGLIAFCLIHGIWIYLTVS